MERDSVLLERCKTYFKDHPTGAHWTKKWILPDGSFLNTGTHTAVQACMPKQEGNYLSYIRGFMERTGAIRHLTDEGKSRGTNISSIPIHPPTPAQIRAISRLIKESGGVLNYDIYYPPDDWRYDQDWCAIKQGRTMPRGLLEWQEDMKRCSLGDSDRPDPRLRPRKTLP